MTTQELTDDNRAQSPDEWFAGFGESTHYEGCWRWHAECAYGLAADERDAARTIAVRLEQELAETINRCRELVLRWAQTGHARHAADLAAALDLTDDNWGRP